MSAAEPLLAKLAPPDPALFFSRGTPDDPRLGDKALRGLAAYPRAKAVLLGCPQDEGVRRNKGRVGAAEGPAALRAALYRLVAAPPLDKLELLDLGDLPPGPELEDTHAALRSLVGALLRDGKRVVVLGGGNDLSYPDCAALHDAFGEAAAINVDAHLDVRPDEPRNSGTPYRQLLEEKLVPPDRFFEFGFQPFANAAGHLDWARRRGVRLFPLEEVRRRGAAAAMRDVLSIVRGEQLFAGLDLDAVRASDAPGVSAPSPTGLFAEDLLDAARLLGRDRRLKVLEVTELSPRHDVDGRTAKLAALAVWEALRGLVDHS